MKISEVMTSNVTVASPDQSIQDAAAMMLKLDAGALPVGDDDRLIGMITDRDIALRAVARGKGVETRIRDVMTKDVRYCFDDQDTDEIAETMGSEQVRRLPVINRDKRLVGIVSLGDLALQRAADDAAGDALSGISRPAGSHNQA